MNHHQQQQRRYQQQQQQQHTRPNVIHHAGNNNNNNNNNNARTKDPRKAFFNRTDPPRPSFPTRPTNNKTTTTTTTKLAKKANSTTTKKKKNTNTNTTSSSASNRTVTITTNSDGFEIAEEDESSRGCWDPFSVRGNSIGSNSTSTTKGDSMFDYVDGNDDGNVDDDDDGWNNYGNSLWNNDAPAANTGEDPFGDVQVGDDAKGSSPRWSNFRNVAKPVRVVDWPSSSSSSSPSQGTKSVHAAKTTVRSFPQQRGAATRGAARRDASSSAARRKGADPEPSSGNGSINGNNGGNNGSIDPPTSPSKRNGVAKAIANPRSSKQQQQQQQQQQQMDPPSDPFDPSDPFQKHRIEPPANYDGKPPLSPVQSPARSYHSADAAAGKKKKSASSSSSSSSRRNTVVVTPDGSTGTASMSSWEDGDSSNSNEEEEEFDDIAVAASASSSGNINDRRTMIQALNLKARRTMKQALNLEARLSKLAVIDDHHNRSRTIVLDNSVKSARSAVSNRSDAVSIAQSFSSAAQPSVESECVRQNKEIAMEMMEGAMMDFFVDGGGGGGGGDPAEAEGGGAVEEKDFGPPVVDHWKEEVGPTTPPRRLQPLVEDEVGLFEEPPGDRDGGRGGCEDGADADEHELYARDVEFHRKQYELQQQQLQLQQQQKQKQGQQDRGQEEISVNEDEVPATQHQEQQGPEYLYEPNAHSTTHVPPSPLRSKVSSWSKVPPKSKIQRLLMPSPLAGYEFEDTSVFGMNSLISESSSEMTPASSKAERLLSPTQQLGLQPPVAAPVVNRKELAMELSDKNKDLSKFLDRFSDHILKKCHKRGDDANSPDVFSLDDGDVVVEEENGESKKKKDDRFTFEPVGVARDDDDEASQQDTMSVDDNADSGESPGGPNAVPPPASAFLSVQGRARARHHNDPTTRLFTASSRGARRMRSCDVVLQQPHWCGDHASMCSIEEGKEEEPWKEDREGGDVLEKGGSAVSPNRDARTDLGDLVDPTVSGGRQHRLNLLSISARTAATFREHFDEDDDHKRRGVSPLYRSRHDLSVEDINDEVHSLGFIQEERSDENDDDDGADNDKTDSRDDEYTHDKLLKDLKDIISKQSSCGGSSSVASMRETENTSSAIAMKQQPSVAEMFPVTSADSTVKIGSASSSPRRLSNRSYATPSPGSDARGTNNTPGKDCLDVLSNRFLEPSGATPDKKSPPPQGNRKSSLRSLKPPAPQQQLETASADSNGPQGKSISPRVIASIPKKKNTTPSIAAQPSIASSANDGAPIFRQLQMSLDPDQVMPSVAQMRALFNKDLVDDSSSASGRQQTRQPLPKHNNLGSTKSNHVNPDPLGNIVIRKAQSVAMQALTKKPNNAEGNSSFSAKALTRSSSGNNNKDIIQSGKMTNVKGYWSQLEANNKSSSSEKVFAKPKHHPSSKTNNRTNAAQHHQVPSWFEKKGNFTTDQKQKENLITTTETNRSSKSNDVNPDPLGNIIIRTAQSVAVQPLTKKPNNTEGNNTSSANAITRSSSGNNNSDIIQSGKMTNVKDYWSQLEANNKSSSSEKVFTKPKQHSSSKTNNRTNASLRNQIPSGFNKKDNSTTGQSKNATDDASQHSSVFSQHSSIFEAFEVAPLQTFSVGKDNPGDTSDFLNDFGVHHAFVKRGAKKVGSPETCGISGEQPSDPENAFEVTLQPGSMGREAAMANKQPPPHAGSSPTSVHNHKVSNSASGGQQIVNDGSSKNNSFRRIQSGWKKMVNPGGTAPSVPYQHGASVPASGNIARSGNKMDPPSSAVGASSARSHFNKKTTLSNN